MENGALRQGPASDLHITSTRNSADTAKSSRPLYVWAEGHKPSARRRYWLLIVRQCPYCAAGQHAHRGGEGGGLRRAGCGRGEYFLKIRPVLGAAA
jgi:hypothetical protein